MSRPMFIRSFVCWDRSIQTDLFFDQRVQKDETRFLKLLLQRENLNHEPIFISLPEWENGYHFHQAHGAFDGKPLMKHSIRFLRNPLRCATGYGISQIQYDHTDEKNSTVYDFLCWHLNGRISPFHTACRTNKSHYADSCHLKCNRRLTRSTR